MNYSKIILEDSPRDRVMNETGFYNWLVWNGSPSFKDVMADVECYLNGFGFVKGEDTIDRIVLDSLKHIHRYFQSSPKANR